MILSTDLTWVVARAGGMVAFTLLTLAVVVGLLLSGRARITHWPRFALEDVHRFLGLVADSFIAVHVLVLLVDGYLPFSLADILVPGSARYRPLAVALGIVAAELLVALAVANRFRSHISYRAWRVTHYLNFAIWGLALAHGILAGTDAGSGWATLLYGVAAAAVAGLTVWRALERSTRGVPSGARTLVPESADDLTSA